MRQEIKKIVKKKAMTSGFVILSSECRSDLTGTSSDYQGYISVSVLLLITIFELSDKGANVLWQIHHLVAGQKMNPNIKIDNTFSNFFLHLNKWCHVKVDMLAS